jgi:hypothetical protein
VGHKKKSEEPFEFPNSVLNQIEECSAGGYVLFVFDTEGKPVVYSYFDNTPNAMAMNFYIDNWTKALAKINLDITIESIHKDVDEENL